MWTTTGTLKILDIDLENRPLSYLGMDWTSAEITGIAWAWITDEPPQVTALLLQKDEKYRGEHLRKRLSPRATFGMMAELLAGADMVTGHYLRKHALPLLNGAMIEHGLPPLRRLLVQDTKMDLVKRKDLSASQENLASMFALPEAKHHMTQTEWRKANRLSPEGMAATYKRVTDDVLQHIALRRVLVERRLLHPPSRWEP